MRAFAVVWVMLLHAGYSVAFPAWLGGFASRGAHGVTVFFVLSGFLITWLLLEEEQRRGSFSLRDFYLRRAFRILPPVLLFLGGLMVLSPFMPLGFSVWDGLGCLLPLLHIMHLFAGAFRGLRGVPRHMLLLLLLLRPMHEGGLLGDSQETLVRHRKMLSRQLLLFLPRQRFGKGYERRNPHLF